MSLSVSPNGPAASFVKEQPWRNWAGNVEATPKYTVTAASDEEVADAVRFARANDLKVRVVGTGHSWTGLGATDGVQINVQNLKHFRVADRDRKVVTMGAGTSIFEACEALWEEGFSLKNQGDIDVQTLAGAASTGTHGSGITLANMASSIKRIKLVDGQGNIVEVTEDDPDALRAARVSLGTIGIFTEIDLEVTDRYYLEEYVTFPSWDELVENWDANVQENLHSSLLWCPTEGGLDLFDIVAPDIPLDDHAHRRRINQVEEQKPQSDEWHRVDRNYLIYHGTFTGPYIEFEYFVPAERSLEVMTRIREALHSEFPDERFPIQPRWVKGDQAGFLSPCWGRDSVGISICADPNTDYLTFLRGMHNLFLDYGARPHWGKFHFFDKADAQSVFPEFDAFNAVRARFDPDNIFLNDVTAKLFG